MNSMNYTWTYTKRASAAVCARRMARLSRKVRSPRPAIILRVGNLVENVPGYHHRHHDLFMRSAASNRTTSCDDNISLQANSAVNTEARRQAVNATDRDPDRKSHENRFQPTRSTAASSSSKAVPRAKPCVDQSLLSRRCGGF